MSSLDWKAYDVRYRAGTWRAILFRDIILEEVGRRGQPTTVLDIGCGTGFDNDHGIQQVIAGSCSRYVGVEPDPNVPTDRIFTHVYHSTFEEAPIRAESVDVAFAVMVLEHIADPVRFIRKLHRVLVAGGVFWGFTMDVRHYFCASLPESVGELWLGKRSEGVIQGRFNGLVSAETVRFSGGQFHVVVETLDRAG